MNLQEDMRINEYSPTEGVSGTLLGEAFDRYIKQFGVHNIHFICSLTYNLGKIHGKREERVRRKRHEC